MPIIETGDFYTVVTPVLVHECNTCVMICGAIVSQSTLDNRKTTFTNPEPVIDQVLMPNVIIAPIMKCTTYVKRSSGMYSLGVTNVWAVPATAT